MRLIYIDHYDSFTYNIIDWLEQSSIKAEIELIPYDNLHVMRQILERPAPLVLSPGPGSAMELTSTYQIVEKLLGKVPILGICLGHQLLGRFAGLNINRSSYPLHGACKVIKVLLREGFFSNFPEFFRAASYHSLIAERGRLQNGWQVSLECDKGEIQGIEFAPNQANTAIGVQFHPESFLSEDCHLIRERWMAIVRRWYLAS